MKCWGTSEMMSLNLSELNEYVGPRCLRRYQYLIANNIDFSINIDGSFFKIYRSYILGDQNILIFLGADSPFEAEYFELQSGNAGNGYELQDNFLKLNSNQFNFNNEYIDASLVVVGHWNFAHFIWNQLSALHFLMLQGCGAYLAPIRSCLIDLESAFPNSKFSDEGSISLFKHSIYLGGQYLNSDAHQFLMNSIKNKLKVIDQASPNKYYLGIRGAGIRAIKNEVEFYVFFIEEVLKFQTDAVFYIDGFSFTSANILVPSSVDRAVQINKIIENLVLKFGEHRVININAISLFDALSYIKIIDYYVTHEGTMQHKIGWFFTNKRGLILSKSKFARSVSLWHKDQVSGALAPSFLSPESYEYDNDSRDSSFAFLDPKQSAIEALNILLNSQAKS